MLMLLIWHLLKIFSFCFGKVTSIGGNVTHGNWFLEKVFMYCSTGLKRLTFLIHGHCQRRCRHFHILHVLSANAYFFQEERHKQGKHNFCLVFKSQPFLNCDITIFHRVSKCHLFAFGAASWIDCCPAVAAWSPGPRPIAQWFGHFSHWRILVKHLTVHKLVWLLQIASNCQVDTV